MRLPEALSRAPVRVGALELRELRYFAAAASTGNLGRAAQELGVTPPAISQQLRKLEDLLGARLLIRHSRGVTPTQAGARLLERIGTVLRLLDAPLDPEQAAADGTGTISLAVPAEFSTVLAAPLIRLVRSHWPAVTIDLKESTGGGSEIQLLDRRIDIALLPDAPALDELRIEPLLTERLGLVAAPSAALARSSLPLRLRELAGVPLILPGPRHWIRRLLARAGFQRGVLFRAVLQVDSVPMTREMVRSGLGCAILPAASVRDETARGALVFRPIEQPALSATHAIAVRRMAPPLVREIAQAMGDAIRSLAATGTWPGAQPVGSPVPPSCLEHSCLTLAPEMPPETWLRPVPEGVQRSLEYMEGD